MELLSKFRPLLALLPLLLTVGCGADSLVDAATTPESSTPSFAIAGATPARPFVPVNVNLASATALARVPGIGDALAARIVDARAHRSLFANPSDIANVQGIGAASMQGMLPYLVAKIDLNAATKTALEALPLIGDGRATAILAYRDAHGAFHDVSELALVPGLDASVVATVAPFVKATHVAPNPGSPLVNLNDADLDTLEALPGLGYAKSSAVMRWRNEHGLFKHVDDLIDVPGIGPETLEGVRHLVTTTMPGMSLGTFAVEGTWRYDDGVGGITSGRFAVESLMLTLAEGYAGEIAVIDGICDGSVCDPLALQAVVTSTAPNGDFTYRLSGSTATGWSVASVAASEGTVTSSTLSGGFYARNGGKSWQVMLTGYRILD